MKLTDEERQILVNLEYEKAVALLVQAEGNAAIDRACPRIHR